MEENRVVQVYDLGDRLTPRGARFSHSDMNKLSHLIPPEREQGHRYALAHKQKSANLKHLCF